MTIDEMIAVLQAAKAGKTVQVKLHTGDWFDRPQPYAGFNFAHCDYRVKPEPREWWFNDYGADPCLTSSLSLYLSKEAAHKAVGTTAHRCIHVREVLD